MVRILSTLALAGALCLASLARAEPPPVETYGKLPAVELVSLSPSGDCYAYVTVDGENLTLIVSSFADSKLLVHASLGDVKLRDISWAGEGHVLFTTTNTVDLGWQFTTAKAELASVKVLNLVTHKSFTVFGANAAVANTVRGRYGIAQVAGHWYGYFGGITYGASKSRERFLDTTIADLYRVDLDTGAISKIASGSRISEDWLVGPTGEIIARSTYDQLSGQWKVLTDNGVRVLASGNAEFGGLNLHLGQTPDELLIAEPRPTDGARVYVQLPLSGAPAAPVADSATIQRPLFDRTSGLWIGSIAGGDQPRARLFAPDLEARMAGTLKAFPKLNVALESWNGDFTRMIVFTTGGDDSGTYWLVDIAKHSAVPLGYQYPTIQPEDVGPIRMVDWKAADGLALRGVLTLPPGWAAKNLPLVVLPHGGPEARDYPVFDWWAQAFASRGYAVFQPNFRGSAGYGGPFRNAGLGQWGRKMQTDISDGVAELAERGIIDPKRACIVGGSYGGYAALAGVTVQQGLYRCAVSVAGVSDPGGMIRLSRQTHTFDSAETRYWKAFMGANSISDAELDAISPLKLAKRADAPILLIHGKDDTVVPPAQSTAMEAALRGADKPVELIWLPGEDHHLSREATRVLMLNSAVAFVEKYDPPDAAPRSEAKAGN
jgi:dienelactone hydrolase